MEQGYPVWERIRFLLVHMMQMELLIVLVGTTAASWLLSITLRKKNARLGEQILSRNIAAVYAVLVLLLLLGRHFFR